MRVTLPNGFVARPYQVPFMRYLDKGGKRAMWVMHRRAGKDLTALHQTCKMMHRRRGVYWHIYPTAEQGKKAIWEGFTKSGERIMEQVFPSAIRKTPRTFAPSGEMVVELRCGSIWRLMGSDKIEVVGAGPVGVVFSEYAVAKPRTWDLVRPMLRENEGWAAFITTPRGKNHAFKLYEMAKADPRWFCELKSLFDTRAYDPEETIAEERAEGMPEELIEQEYLCSWTAALVGSFFGAQLTALEAKGGIRDFTHDTHGVFTSWDLGKADDTAVWWWRVTDDGIDVLDHYASHGHDLDHYFAVLKTRAERHGWQYRRHWLPHDARAKTLATKASVLEQFIAEVGPGAVGIVPNMLVKDGIQAARARLLHPGTRIHSRCSLLSDPKDCDALEALRGYRREWDDEKKCFRDAPVHDWTSHCFAPETLVLTRNGMCRFDMLPSTGEVMTPCGWKQYRNPRISRRDAPLVMVTFADGTTARCTPDHLFLTVDGWKSASDLQTGSSIQSSLTRLRRFSMAASIASGHLLTAISKARRGFTATCGLGPLVPSLAAATSITATGTDITIASRISSACQPRSISLGPGLSPRPASLSISLSRLVRRLLSGIAQKRAAFGILATPSEPRAGRNGNENSVRAGIAASALTRSSGPMDAPPSGARLAAKPLAIAHVERLNARADVWDITVPGVECFSLANGAVVHNSADAFRYMAIVAPSCEAEMRPKRAAPRAVFEPKPDTLGNPWEN